MSSFGYASKVIWLSVVFAYDDDKIDVDGVDIYVDGDDDYVGDYDDYNAVWRVSIWLCKESNLAAISLMR